MTSYQSNSSNSNRIDYDFSVCSKIQADLPAIKLVSLENFISYPIIAIINGKSD